MSNGEHCPADCPCRQHLNVLRAPWVEAVLLAQDGGSTQAIQSMRAKFKLPAPFLDSGGLSQLVRQMNQREQVVDETLRSIVDTINKRLGLKDDAQLTTHAANMVHDPLLTAISTFADRVLVLATHIDQRLERLEELHNAREPK